jgi:hypothetical protein
MQGMVIHAMPLLLIVLLFALRTSLIAWPSLFGWRRNQKDAP